MDRSQYSTLMDVLAVIPDPRKARGKRFCWLVLLTLVAAGLASGQQTARAIAQWVVLHADALRAALPQLSRLPSESTLLRTLRLIDVSILETAVAGLTEPQTRSDAQPAQVVTPSGTILEAQAVDGKALRGATACGAKTHLVSLVQHGTGSTLAQAAVERKRSEITAVPALLRERDLLDTITTMDALLTQRALAELIDARHGYYLMIVKANQPQLRDDLALFFEVPAIVADQERWDRVETSNKGHGRLETRILECTTGDCAYYVPDVTLGEDRNHMRTGDAPEILAAVPNGLLALWRRAGWTNSADAVRATAASVVAALTFIGAIPTLT